MKRLFKNHWPVILVLLLAAILRFYALGSVPPSLMWDETSWGYNAYSILKTGRDEYGNFMPLIFKAFGDYKSAIYVYLTVPSVAIFGLNEFAVRFPAAVFGTISIFLYFFIVREIFREFKGKDIVGMLASVILAFSPWNYHYSRGAWEVNVLLVLLFLALIFFLKAEAKKVYFFYLAALFFGLSFYVYNSAKLLIPLIILGLLVFYREKLKQFSFKNYFISFLILGFLVLPVAKFTFFDGAGGRLRVMSVFSYPRPEKDIQEILNQDQTKQSSLVFQLFHNESLNFIRGILGRYFNHFSGRFLFFEGDWSNPRHGVPYAGVLNFMDILLLPLGVYFLVSQKIKGQSLVWYLLLITPLPAALSRDSVQATRSFFMVIPLMTISALGMYFIWERSKEIKNFLRVGLISLGVIGYLLGFVYYLDQFFIHAPRKYSQFWQYGYKQAIEFVGPIAKNYDKIVFTQKYGQPYIYWLFYTKYNPTDYQKQARLTESSVGDVGEINRLDNIEFRNIYWPQDRDLTKTIFVGDEFDLPITDLQQTPGAKILKEIRFLNNQLAFRIVEKK